MAKFDKKENNTVHFSVEIKANEFENALQKAYLSNRGKIMIPGFRKGKVPRKIIEMHYGEDIFFEDAINEILPELYDNAIKELEIEAVDQPKVDLPDDIKKGEDFVATFQVDVKPEITLADFDDLVVEEIVEDFDESLIEKDIEDALAKNARLVAVEGRSIQDGDIVNITYEGKIDGELFEGGSDSEIDLHIGSGTFIPGFEEGLIGLNTGDEVSLELTFPEEYHVEELAEKDVVFDVTVNAIQTREVPEMDDEFVKDISEFDTVEEYKANVRERLQKEHDEKAKHERERNAVNTYVEKIEVEIPNGMVEDMINEEINNVSMQLSNMGISLEQYLQMTGSDMNSMREHLRGKALHDVKVRLTLEAIVDKEQFEISPEALEEEIYRIAKLYASDNEELEKQFIEELKSGDSEYTKKGLQHKKAVEFIMNKAKFVKKEIEKAVEETDKVIEETVDKAEDIIKGEKVSKGDE